MKYREEVVEEKDMWQCGSGGSGYGIETERGRSKIKKRELKKIDYKKQFWLEIPLLPLRLPHTLDF